MSLILTSLSLVTGTSRASDRLLPPSYLIGGSEQDGCVPLYWFKPGSDSYELAYDDGTKAHQFYVSDYWAQNKAAVRMSSPALPFALLSSEVFISYQGRENDTLYDFRTPFLVSVNRDSVGLPGRVLAGPSLAFASGSDTAVGNGEWAEITHDLVFQETSDFWVVFQWKEDTPASPLIGLDQSSSSGRSFYHSFNDYGYFEWREWTSHNFMIRSVIVTHDSTDTLTASDGFKIYRSDQKGFSVSPETVVDSVGGDQFSYNDYDVENSQTYFYRLTSVCAGEESDPSNQVEATPKSAADLGVSRNSIEVSLDTNQCLLEHLNVSNNGGIPLEFEMRMSLIIDDSVGGTDHFGYTWTDSRKTEGLAFNWVDIADDGVLLNQGDGAEYVFGPIPLNFPFPFYGAKYDSLWVTLNGCLCFRRVGLLKWVNDTLPNPHTHLNLIAPFWSNLWFDENTKIYCHSTSDSFVVSFIDMKHFKSGKYCTFQVVLTQKGTIDFQYQEVEDPSTPATIGVQNEDGTCALLISCNDNYLQNSFRVRIVPGWIGIEPRKGEVAPGENLAVNLLFNSDFAQAGKYSGTVKIESWDKNHPLDPVTISLILNVANPADTTADTTHSDTTSLSETQDESVLRFRLEQNYPNPFNPRTTIPFTVHGKQKTENGPIRTSLKVYNIRGELVRTLLNEKRIDGEYRVTWDGKNEKGENVASGLYFCRLKAGDFSHTKKMILLR